MIPYYIVPVADAHVLLLITHACHSSAAPGHEIAGIVKAVGPDVKGFKVGDRVGVGCMVESCRSCDLCKEGLENHCLAMCQTYSSDFPADKGPNMEKAVAYHTNGGYSTDITVSEHFVFHIPEGKFKFSSGFLMRHFYFLSIGLTFSVLLKTQRWI